MKTRSEFTQRHRFDALKAQARCAMCGEPVGEGVQFDHILPLAISISRD